MNVRDLEISLRPRKGWEAVDLGFILTKSHYRDCLTIGGRLFLPIWIIIFALTWKIPGLGLFLIWLMKPIYDRFYLHLLSRRIFGAEVTAQEVIRMAPQLFFKRVLPLLTIRRLSPTRSMTLPVHDLEQQKGSSYSSRCDVVKRVGGDVAMTTTLTMHAIEGLACLGIVFLLTSMIPEQEIWTEEDQWLQFFNDKQTYMWLSRLTTGLYMLIYLLLEPFYVGAGFCLYLNSRSSQEAWDIELRFREFAGRVKNSIVKVASVLLLGLVCAWSVLPQTASAERQPDPQVVIDEIYQDEVFEIHTRIDKKLKEPENEDDLGWLKWLLDWLDTTSDSDGDQFWLVLFKLIGITLLVTLVMAVLWVLSRQLRQKSGNGVHLESVSVKRDRPETILGMEISRESLPDDLIEAARGAWTDGDLKLGLSYLYRGALSRIVIDHDAEIESSDTEYQCLRAADKVLAMSDARYFQTLSRHWLTVAYSNYSVADTEFDSLCQQWPFHE